MYCLFCNKHHRAFEIPIVIKLAQPVAVDLDHAGERLVRRHVREEAVWGSLVVDLDRFVIVIVASDCLRLRIVSVLLLQINLRRRLIFLCL